MQIVPLDSFFIQNIWLALITLAAVYASDYFLTIYSARLYRTYLKDHTELEGSFELTPAFQRDVDRLRWLSPRFLIAPVLSIVTLFALWMSAVGFFDQPRLCAFVMGVLFLREVAIRVRHSRNIVLFRAARTPGSVTGESNTPGG